MTGRSSLVQQLRHRAGVLRWRIAPPKGAKGDAELHWWQTQWDPAVRAGELQGPDTLALSGDGAVADTYEGRRWQQARAEPRRVLSEAGIEDEGFFAGKVVLDIGSGPVGLPDALASTAAVSLSIEPLAERFAQAGLLLDSSAVYLSCPAEAMPLRSASVDVVISRNNLDHVDDPVKVLAEVKRVLRPGGAFILNVDIDHSPTVTEPHRIDLASLRAWLVPLTIEREQLWPHSHGMDGRAVVLVAMKPRPSVRSNAYLTRSQQLDRSSVEHATKETAMGLSDSRVETVIAVSDLDRARRFYGEQLGLGPGTDEADGVRYHCGEGTAVFVYLSVDNAGTSTATVAGWFLDDFDATLDELATRGITLEQYDQPGLKTDERGVFDAGRFRAVWVRDPDGNTMAITEASG